MSRAGFETLFGEMLMFSKMNFQKNQTYFFKKNMKKQTLDSRLVFRVPNSVSFTQQNDVFDSL